MLPFELWTLVLLASASAAYPQHPSLANVTQTSAPPPTTILPTSGIPESTTSFDQINDCPKPHTCSFFIIPELTSVTGFEDPNEKPTNKPGVILRPSRSPPITVQTTPTVIGIQTNFAPTVGPGNDENPSRPGQTTGPGHGDTPYSPSPQDPSNNNLLDEIISRVTNPQQPTGSEHVEPAPQVTGPGVPIINGQPITVGPTSLMLTPGLSTSVGTGTDATFIGITTDGTGQTIITLSSSGTAVTATITNAPRTVTMGQSGFDASLTEAARPGDVVRTSSGGAAAATSSKGVASDRRDGMEWWVGFALGVIGVGVAL